MDFRTIEYFMELRIFFNMAGAGAIAEPAPHHWRNRMKSMSAVSSVILATAMTALLSSAGIAGSCPADKMMADARQPGPSEPVGVDDKVIASIDLAAEAPKLDERKFRMRRLVIQPGGVVPWHSHGERPAIIYIVSGAVVEYRSTCAVPIVHKAGEVTEEVHTTSHWWKNQTRKPVVLLSADILHDKSDPHTM